MTNSQKTSDQPIDHSRSIKIIAKIIADTSATIDNQSGKYFLVWGYTTVIISLIEYFAQIAGVDRTLCLCAWWLIPVIGGIGTMLLAKSEKRGITRPKSYVDRSISTVWLVCGVSYGMMFIASWVYGTNILFLTTY